MGWEWFNTGAGVASIVGLIVTIGGVIQALITGRSTRRLQADIHAATQTTLTDLGKGFRESQERMDQRWHAAFERMDRAAEQRQTELKALWERRT
jgi:hypothetical protein